jgi:lysophospholipase L1-like esterase
MIKIPKFLLFTLYNVIAVFLIFLIVEFLCSTGLFIYNIHKNKGLAEKRYTEYDELLGWINMPNIYIRDMYGPGIYLKTNGQRLRSNHNFSLYPSSKRVRVICSGDSLTFGFGVDNDHTWGQQLAALNDKLETINMAQGGYGIDQAYLWYKRDGQKLNPDILIFAFITSDFNRMKSDKFLGFAKPLLKLENHVLVTQNVPVPKPFSIWLKHQRLIVANLSSIRILNRLFYKVFWGEVKPNDKQTRELALKIFQDLMKINQERNITTVFVYLPIQNDYNNNESDPWRQFLHTEAAKHNFFFIDLVDELRKQSPQFIDRLFIKAGSINYAFATGHYTDEGNFFIAQRLYHKLMEIPPISHKLEKIKVGRPWFPM